MRLAILRGMSPSHPACPWRAPGSAPVASPPTALSPTVLALVALALVAPSSAAAQPGSRAAACAGVAGDTTAAARARADSLGCAARAQPLATVTVTGDRQALARVPWAVGVADTRALRRAQLTVGLDEALLGIAGVQVANRYNFAVDQRVSVRGAGARANFGLRGLRVLLDGVPQTLPDGQSQLTNVDLGAIGRVEVLRGSASSLYGNGSGGVLAFTTDMSAPEPFTQVVRAEGGSYGLRKVQARTAGRSGRAVGTLSLSRLTVGGFRPWSGADLRQGSAGVDVAATPTTTVRLRLASADTPEARNPGALTAAEWAATPDAAAPLNVQRGADRRIRQQQGAVIVERATGGDGTLQASVFALGRSVRNALATTPPGAFVPTVGTYNTIARHADGARLQGARRVLGAGGPRLTAGIDLQRMRDDRTNRRATAGRPTAATDTLLVDQRERVTSVGPFAQLAWTPAPGTPLAPLSVSGGLRHDRVRFAVADRFLADGRDDSGARTMAASSWHVGASVALSERLVPYANVATAFETPTTTELQARADDAGGFDATLGPQRARQLELGARGAVGARLSYQAALFRSDVRDAIVQFAEVGGRAYFRNAGRARNVGAELQATARLHPRATVDGAFTWARYRFRDYRVVRGTAVDTLDGRTVPGVPERTLRATLRTVPFANAALDVEHTTFSALWADDRNAVRVPGWGRGRTDLRLAWSTRRGGVAVEPFGGVSNLFGQRYVGAVTVNGANGRVLEPAPGRNAYVGVELGASPRAP